MFVHMCIHMLDMYNVGFEGRGPASDKAESSIHVSTHRSIHMSVHTPTPMPINMSTHMPIHMSIRMYKN